MGIEDYESGSDTGAEAGPSSAEKARENDPAKFSKTLKSIKKTRGDEKKAKRDDDHLARVLRELIAHPRYQFLVDALVPLLSREVPSHFLVGCLSLVFRPAERVARTHYYATARPDSPECPRFGTPVEFHEDTIPDAVRDRINAWIDDMFAVVTYDVSNIIAGKFLRDLRSSSAGRMMSAFARDILEYFLYELNIHISPTRAGDYADFILLQLADRVRATYDPEFFEREDF